MTVLEEVEALKKQQEQAQQEQPLAPAEANNSVQTVPTTQQTVQEELQKAIKDKVKGSSDIKSMAKDLTYLLSASNLQGNEEFTSGYETELGKQFLQELKDEGKRQAIIDAARTQEARAIKTKARNERAQAFYDGVKPIFKLLNIEEPFGLLPMLITVILLMIPFLLVSLIRFVFNSINSIALAVAGFKKPALIICTTLLCILVMAGIGLGIVWGIDQVFGTHIIP